MNRNIWYWIQFAFVWSCFWFSYISNMCMLFVGYVHVWVNKVMQVIYVLMLYECDKVYLKFIYVIHYTYLCIYIYIYICINVYEYRTFWSAPSFFNVEDDLVCEAKSDSLLFALTFNIIVLRDSIDCCILFCIKGHMKRHIKDT